MTKPKKPDCLPGFDQINRFWDSRRKCYVAKILPGEFYVSISAELIATTLGSCVSACIWDEVLKIGGMNHFMLPETDQSENEINWGNQLSDATRYGNYAMEYMINEMLKQGADKSRLKAKIFGGAMVLDMKSNVGHKNSMFVRQYMFMEKISVVSEDLGLEYPRKILFDPLSGQAWVKKIGHLNNNTLISREKEYSKQLQHENSSGDVELF